MKKPIKNSRVYKPTTEKCVDKTLGTSVINSSMSPPPSLSYHETII